MKYIETKEAGGPEVLKVATGPTPSPKEGEVLIRVEAAGVNRPDVLQRKGSYPPPVGASPIIGLEVAGEVVEVGPKVQSLQKGDKVCALVAGGGYAQFCVAPAVQCLPVPKGLSMVEAAAIPETFFTVWFNVFMRGRLQAGESLLVHGGAGGIGTTAIQLGKVFGAKVFTTVGSDEKAQFCLGLGAFAAVNYKTQDFLTDVRKLNEGHGVNMIFDMVAGDYFNKNLELLAFDGRLVQVATQGGEKVSLSFRTLMSKGLTVMGSTLRPRGVLEKGAIAQDLHKNVWPLFESKKIRVIIDKEFKMEEAAEAHRHIDSGEHIGKIVLRV